MDGTINITTQIITTTGLIDTTKVYNIFHESNILSEFKIRMPLVFNIIYPLNICT